MNWRRLNAEVLQLVGERLEYPDVFDPDRLAGNPDLEVQKAGGGYLVRPRRAETMEEIHVFLHGSVRLPAEIRWAVGPCDPKAAASTLVDNCDLGTSALAMELALWIAGDPIPSRCLAFFDVTRVLVDANRYRIKEQVPERPYRGVPILRADLDIDQKSTLAKKLLLPWVDLVSAAITSGDTLRVFHHHTYDPVGQPDQLLDLPGEPRPAGMVFLKCPHETVDGPTGRSSTLLDPRLLKPIVSSLEKGLRQIQPNAEVRVDWPYLCPLMPLLPGLLPWRHPPGPPSQMATIIYEVRKDLLQREEGLHQVVRIIQAMSEEAKAFQSM